MSARKVAEMPLGGAQMPAGGPKEACPGTGSTTTVLNAPAASGRVPAPCPFCGAAPAAFVGDPRAGLFRATVRCAACRESRVAFGRTAQAAETAAREAWDEFAGRASR